MKVTIVRTDKKNATHVSTATLEKFIGKMKTDTKRQTVAELRRQLPLIANYGATFKDMFLLPRVYPAVTLSKDGGDLVYKGWNALVLLTVGGLADLQAVEQAKQLAMSMPSTLAAFVGSSGKSVKVLVRIQAENGMEPQTEDEANALYQAGYQHARRAYGGLFVGHIVEEMATVRASFRMTVDTHPLMNTKATALTVVATAGDTLAAQPMPVPRKAPVHPQVQRNTDYEKYDDYEFLYRKAASQVANDMGTRFEGDPHSDEAYATELARRLHQMDFPEEEAVIHMRSHLWTRAEDEHIRAIVAAAYEEEITKTNTPASVKIRKSQRDVITYLESRYVFRYNTVMGYTEYRPNDTWINPYRPVDRRVMNRMAIECRLEGLNTWDKDIARYVGSSYVPEYNPIEEYLYQCEGKWDGHDRIRELARTVPTNNPYWPDWFHTWFLGMVRQWQSNIYDRYGNQVAPLLISKQGWNKSTFIQSLLPSELQWGYTNQLDVGEKKQTLQAMSQFLLINLDEFNQISPRLQQGFLKNIITLPSVKVKRPYGKHIEPFPRLASFIAATNQTDVLVDPSGSRRFLGVELSAPIDISKKPNHKQLFAQAQAELSRHEPYFFSDEETQQIVDENRRFQQQTPVEQYFYDQFEITDNENQGQYLSPSAIFAHIKKTAGGDLRLNSLNHFGRTLANMPGITRKRVKSGTVYLVKLKK